MSQQNTVHWPTPEDAVKEFYGAQLKLPLALFNHLQVKSPGSGRPKGPRPVLWSATYVLAISALEAGLEELVFSAHGVLTNRSGATKRDIRKILVEKPLVTPSAQTIANLLEAQFGVVLSAVPPVAQFEARTKPWAKGGAGQGSAVPGPTSWRELAEFQSAVMHVRNGTAHGDMVKLRNPPKDCQDLLWVALQSGGWSMQLPHAMTALRTIVSVYNTVAHELDAAVGLFSSASPLRSPNWLVKFT